MKCNCDNPEGNLCQTCEQDIKQARNEMHSDGWWPAIVTGARSINVASTTNEAPKDILYV